MVKYWRKNAINIVLYLDDGFGMSDSFGECEKDSVFAKQFLVDAGFLINEEKSIFVPTQKLEWLGILWDRQLFSLSIPDRRISDLLGSITHIIDLFAVFTVRELVQVTGNGISLSPVVGNLARLMTRYCFMSIEARSWDKHIFLVYPSEILRELYFWRDNVKSVNCKTIASYCPSSVVIYSDASNILVELTPLR
jgi:hypothetical protein